VLKIESFSPLDYSDFKGGYSVSYEQAILTKALRTVPHWNLWWAMIMVAT